MATNTAESTEASSLFARSSAAMRVRTRGAVVGLGWFVSQGIAFAGLATHYTGALLAGGR